MRKAILALLFMFAPVACFAQNGGFNQNASAAGGITFVAAVPGTCTPGVTASVQLSVAPYTVNYCSAMNTWTSLTGGGGTSVFPVTVSGTVTSGGIPCFNSTTNEQTSAALGAGVLVAGGGAGACVAGTLATDNGTSLTYTGTGGFVGPSLNSAASTDVAVAPGAGGNNNVKLTPTGTGVVLIPNAAVVAFNAVNANDCGIAEGTAVYDYVEAVSTNGANFCPIKAGGAFASVINCATTTTTNCFLTGEATAATGSGAVEHQITTLTTSTAIDLQLTQGANGPAAANAPALINVSAAAAGGVAAATGGGFVGAPVTMITGAGSAAGATSGAGGTGGAYSFTTGAGGAGSSTTGNGGIGGAYGVTAGNGGAAGGNTANSGGAGGAISHTTGTGAQGAATGPGGAAGVYTITGGVGGRGGATSGTGGAGGDITLTAGNGGVATAGSTTGRGGNVNLNPGVAGATGTAGAQGVVQINGAPASYSTILTSGTSWTSPVNLQRTSNVKITMIGGGNAGGTSAAATIGLPGGAGCTIIVEGSASTLGLVANTAYTYAIGSASGGSTTFNNGTSTNTAAGGTAGGTLSSAAIGVALGGVGGACTVNFGSVGTTAASIPGQPGTVGEILVITTTYQTGTGGSTPLGTGGQPVISGVVGNPGTGYGAGGSGGGVGTHAGGAGTAGAILIEITI